jgi:hypothetical protein
VFRQIFQLHTQGVDLIPSGRRDGWGGIPSYRKEPSRPMSAEVIRLLMIQRILGDSPRPLPLLLAGTPALAPTGVFPRPGAARTGALAGGWFTICPPLPQTIRVKVRMISLCTASLLVGIYGKVKWESGQDSRSASRIVFCPVPVGIPELLEPL